MGLKRQARAVAARSRGKETTTRRRWPLFERLKQGMEAGIAHAHEEPPEIDATTLAALRAHAGTSQAVFAKMLNVSMKTLPSWEQWVRRPSDAARRLIQVFSEYPGVICRSAGLPEITLKGVEVEHLPKDAEGSSSGESRRRKRRAV